MRHQKGKLSVYEVKFYPNYKHLAGYWLIRDSANHATHSFCINTEIRGLQSGGISWSLMMQFTYNLHMVPECVLEVDLMIHYINNKEA